MAHTLKQSNRHAPHPTTCESCGRALPRRTTQTGHVGRCSTCIKGVRSYWCRNHKSWHTQVSA